MRLTIFLTAALLFTFCKTKQQSTPEPTKTRPPLEKPAEDPVAPIGSDPADAQALIGTYQILEANGMAVPTTLGATMIIGEKLDLVSGFTSCNRYDANLSVSKTAFKVGSVSATEKGCEQKKMETENAIYAAFRKTNSYKLEGENRLIIHNIMGKPILVLQKAGK